MIYLLSVVVTAIASGLLLNYFYTVTGTVSAPAGAWMLPDPVKYVTAAVFLAVMAYAVATRKRGHDL
jgi:hypothetical protein